MNKTYLLFFVFHMFVYCEFFYLVSDLGANSTTLTNQETLSYLVNNSDVIAIIDIKKGTDKKRILSFTQMPQSVSANVITIIKGTDCPKIINILAAPKYRPPNTLKSSVVLRNGKHLAFLHKDENNYRPSTGFSMLTVSQQGKVYPIWNQNKDGDNITSGRLLDLVIAEIEMEIEFAE